MVVHFHQKLYYERIQQNHSLYLTLYTMFIKKDLRKIPKILEDAIDCSTLGDDNDDTDPSTMTTEPRHKRSKVETPLSTLRLGRRQQEFQGSVKILCQPRYLPKLQCLQNLNLYDCAISSLDGIGVLQACPKLEILNLGRNPLTTLPDELSALSQSLKHLWMDDCQLTGPLPPCIVELEQLQSLRASNNQLTHIPDSITQLKRLQVLCLDRNPLQSLPEDLYGLHRLEELYLRHVGLEQLPRRLPSRKLKILHLSSNPLVEVDSLVQGTPGLQELTQLYLNGCQLTRLPPGIVAQHPKLERLVISHNPPLLHAPIDVWHAIRGKEMVASTADILWQPNPQLKEGVTEIIVAEMPTTSLLPESLSSSDDDEDESMLMEGVEQSKE